MEATVRILSQSDLITRQYTDKKTGEQKVINSVRSSAPVQGAVLYGGS